MARPVLPGDRSGTTWAKRVNRSATWLVEGVSRRLSVLFPPFVKHRFSVLGQGAPVLDLGESVSKLDAQAVHLHLYFSEPRPVVIQFALTRGQLVGPRHGVPGHEATHSFGRRRILASRRSL